MQKLKMTSYIVLSIVVIAAVALRLAIPRISGASAATGVVSVNGQSSLGDCPDTPNCQGSESSRDEQSVDRFSLSKPADDAIETLAAIVLSQPGTEIIKQDERYLHAIFVSRIMGYTDDVEFLVADDGQNVQVRSASRIGKSDLGANARRLELLRSLSKGKI